MKIIQLEGIDKTGKTTLANKLKQYFPNYKIIKGHPPKDGDDLFNMTINTMNSMNSNTVYIMDRWYLGETVYGPILRGVSLLSIQDLDTIEYYLTCSGKVFSIYCYTDISEIKEKFISEKENFVNITDIENLIPLYQTQIKNSNLDWFEYDYRIADFNKLLEKIKHKLNI